MTVTRLYPFTLTLRSPALFPGVDGDASGARSLLYVPGSSVRGAVARALTAAGRDGEIDELVLSGAVRYLHAYPHVGGVRAYPCPLSLRTVKGDEARAVDLSAFPADGLPWPAETLQGAPGAFVAGEGADRTAVTPAVSTRVHHQRDRQVGRATRAQGALFSYGALEPGQEFAGFLAVTAADPAAADALRARVAALLGNELFLGRSRRAEYGGAARISWRPPMERELAGHPALLAADLAAGDAFRVLCLADVIVRARNTGQVDPAALPDMVINALGGRVALDSGDSRQALFTQTQVVGGYNRTWGLPLPQAAAAKAGSVLCLRARTAVPLADLLAVEAQGVGERRAEGFGRVAFLLPATASAVTFRRWDAPPPPAWRPPLPAPAAVMELEDRVLADAVTLAIGRAVADLAPDGGRLPRPSLLGRLRIPFRRPPAEALQTLRGWLTPRPDADAHALRPPARAQLERCRVTLGSERLTLADALRIIADLQDERVARWLGFDEIAAGSFLITLEHARARLADRRRQERTRVVLARAVIETVAEAARRQGRQTHEANGDGDANERA
jgi:CRISPR-associated protein Csx10